LRTEDVLFCAWEKAKSLEICSSFADLVREGYVAGTNQG